MGKLKKSEFNLIASSCGSGKSYFVEHHLLDYFKTDGIEAKNIIFITSRSVIVDQQTSKSEDKITKFNPHDINTIRNLNGEVEDIEVDYNFLPESGIITMTYDKLINILVYCNNPDRETLGEIKIVVFDECHALFSDLFIKNIELLKVWIRDNIYFKNKIFIGLTATPNILTFYHQQWGVNINRLNEQTIVNYKVKNLLCTSYKNIPNLMKYNLNNGKTIIMCYSIKDCFKLKNQIADSEVLVSRSNKQYDKNSMEPIRNYIIRYDSLPDRIYYDNKYHTLNVLITTSTLREGINLNESSGVKNVICCIPDELHISQFVGRCRFNIENLIVVDEYIHNEYSQNSYLHKCKQEFIDYINDNRNKAWFNSIKHLLFDSCTEPKRILIDKGSFKQYLKDNWISKDKRIIYPEQRQEILDIAIGCKIIKDITPSRITFNRVVDYIENNLKYEVITGRCTVDGKKMTYKKITTKQNSK
jgi:hypothetical protein